MVIFIALRRKIKSSNLGYKPDIVPRSRRLLASISGLYSAFSVFNLYLKFSNNIIKSKRPSRAMTRWMSTVTTDKSKYFIYTCWWCGTETGGEFFCFPTFPKLPAQLKNNNRTQNSNILKFNNEK